jgi:CheY-like chemotaxis protein
MSCKSLFSTNVSIGRIRKLFSQNINLLLIEDHPQICRLLQDDFFQSPVFNKKSVHTVDEAKRAISGSSPVHCWIVDLTLEQHNDGLELIKLKPNFPYRVVVSGAQSMSDATEALKAGAYSVYDKKNIFLSDPHKFIEETCALSILSFIFKARRPMKFELFQVLIQGFITTSESWSNSCWINERTFRRLCEEESFLTVKQFLSLYHALNAIVLSDCLLPGMPGFEGIREKIIQRIDYYGQCAHYVVDHLDSVFGPRYLKQF